MEEITDKMNNINEIINLIDWVEDNNKINNNLSVCMLIAETTIKLEQSNAKKCCSICLQAINGTDVVREINKCKHNFHIDCLEKWFSTNSTCPICRHSLIIVS